MEKFKVKENPTIKEFSGIFEDGIKNKAVLIVTACCRVHNEGRAKSTLELGDRVLIINLMALF